VFARFANRDRLRRLDPVADCHEIYRVLSLEEFPWDVVRALELALYRTFSVPSIARTLDDSGEFRLRAQKRYDDTVLLLSTVVEEGFDSPLGREAVSRINRIHARFTISNDDMLYTLGTFVFVPEEWLDRWGWRPLEEGEREACFQYYRRLGQLMGIRDLPASRADFRAFYDAYEKAQFAYGEPQRRTAVATRELLVSWLPAPLAPAVRHGVSALLDDPVRATFGFPAPPRWLPPLVSTGLTLRAAVERRLPPRRTPASTTSSRLIRSYPDGYAVSELGPPVSRR
jgi:hypothetical protein